jgi:hypothetical protein
MWNRNHPIAPGFDYRLKVALDRIKPPSVMPRYAMARQTFRPWRLAPIALAGAATVLLALTAFAATGSANPVVWTERAASTIGSVGHAPEAAPSLAPSPEATSDRKAPVAAPTHKPAPKASPKAQPTEHPEESPRPVSNASATPSDEDHSGSSSPRPSPAPDDH